MGPLLAHLVGDYVLQSDWMALRKTKEVIPAICHAFIYTLCFLPLTRNSAALCFIFITHLIIDHYRLARYVCWLKNFLAPRTSFEDRKYGPDMDPPPDVNRPQPDGHREGVRSVWWHPWGDCKDTGYHKDRPLWMSVWLMIIADNTLHLLCNMAALKWAKGQ